VRIPQDRIEFLHLVVENDANLLDAFLLAPIGSKYRAFVEDGGDPTPVLELVLVDGEDLGVIVQRGCNEIRSPSSLRVNAGDVGARRSARELKVAPLSNQACPDHVCPLLKVGNNAGDR
jgi:hypothetical protein